MQNDITSLTEINHSTKFQILSLDCKTVPLIVGRSKSKLVNGMGDLEMNMDAQTGVVVAPSVFGDSRFFFALTNKTISVYENDHC